MSINQVCCWKCRSYC